MYLQRVELYRSREFQLVVVEFNMDLLDDDALDNNNASYYDSGDFLELCNLPAGNGFSLIHFNIRSYNSNSDELGIFLDQLNVKPSAIILSETWFSPTHTSDIDGYCAFHVYRDGRRGGGVSIYINNDYVSKVISRWSYVADNIEICSVEVTAGMSRIMIHGVYRPPDKDLLVFTDELLNILSISNRNAHTIVVGDTNVDLISPSEQGTEFINMCHSTSLVPLISVPTRVTQEHVSCIDHVWYNKLCDVRAGVLRVDITDHYPVFAVIPVQSERPGSFVKYFRDHSFSSVDKLRDELYHFCNNFELSLFLNHTNIEVAVQNFIDKLYELYDRCCPIRSKRVSYGRFSKPWITDQHMASINRKHYLFRQYRRGIVTFEEYNTYKNQVTRMIRNAKSRYFVYKFESALGNARESWKLLKTLIGGGRKRDPPDRIASETGILTDPGIIADHFNSYFANVAVNLEKNIPPTNESPLNFMGNRTQSSFFVRPVCDTDVRLIICHLKNKSLGLKSLPTFLYKSCSDLLCPIIAELFNQSVSSGVFPNCLKIARVVPIFKRGDATLVSNYRPISSLPILSKIFEKLMAKQLLSFVKSQGLLYRGQFGFREKSSTSDAILEFLDATVDAIDHKQSVIAVFLDFAKAFDTVSHGILVDKLEHVGIRGIALNWFRTYICSRKQYVGISESKSMMSIVDKGVPQGSVLGPILFLIYINDMRSCSERLCFVHYADDTTVFCSGSDMGELSRNVNAELVKLYEWLKCNRLSLNIDKTTFMIFSDRKNVQPPNLSIADVNIRESEQSNFLGVTIDNQLSFKPHVKSMCNIISRSIGLMNRISSNVPLMFKKNLYYSTVYSRVSYAVLAWGRSSIGNAHLIERLLRRARKVIAYPQARPNQMNDLLNFDSIYKYFCALNIYKITRLNYHPYFFNRLYQLVPQQGRDTRFSTSNCYNTPRCFKSKTQRHFLFQGVHVWNDLPEEIKISNSLHNFKRRLKGHLINLQDVLN